MSSVAGFTLCYIFMALVQVIFEKIGSNMFGYVTDDNDDSIEHNALLFA